ncbi:hypothetical protein ACA910_004630 [Epithemia clementina (nom. ined.)]
MKEELGDGIEVTGTAQILQSLHNQGPDRGTKACGDPSSVMTALEKRLYVACTLIVLDFEFGRGGHHLLRSGLTPFPQSRSSLQQFRQSGNLDRSIFVWAYE